MINNEILNEIKVLKEKLKELENKAQNLQENECERWRAKRKEDYWYVDSLGVVAFDYENYEERDNFRYTIGNYFQTQEEAQEYKENLITKQKLKDLALRLNKEIKIDWENTNQNKYFIGFSHKTKSLIQLPITTWQYLNTFYCPDENFLNIAKKEIGEEAIIKLIKSGV